MTPRPFPNVPREPGMLLAKACLFSHLEVVFHDGRIESRVTVDVMQFLLQLNNSCLGFGLVPPVLSIVTTSTPTSLVLLREHRDHPPYVRIRS